MFQALNNRCGHYALLLAVAVALSFPNLGVPSLWDIDEGNNTEAAREMLDSGNWVVPTFNYQVRDDKPALLYWLQIGAFRLFGINEFAARFPSALAAVIAVLVTYELGRRMFDAATGLLAGVVLASAGLFCAAAHFANPDAVLNTLTALTFLIFWRSYSRQDRGWFVPAGVTAGLAVLAKGPVGLVLPLAVVGLFLLWTRNLRLLWDRRLLWGALAFALVALPWYVLVAVDTKASFLRGFILKHNIDRFLNSMEHHGGPVYYYGGVLALGFAPWSVFLGLAVWYSVREWESGRGGGVVAWWGGEQETSDHPLPHHLTIPPPHHLSDSPTLSLSHAFLWCWIAVYLLFFSLAGTKLPNYILPIYAPLAILTAWFFERWRCRAIHPPAWALYLSLACLALIGIGASLVLLVAEDGVSIPYLERWQLSGLATWAVLGVLPVLGAAGGWWCLQRQQRGGFIVAIAASAVLFIATLFACGSVALDAHKAPRTLVQTSHARQTDREIRVGCYQYFQPSLVFYCRREVQRLEDEGQALEFLRCPLPVYLFVPASVWETVKAKVRGPYHLLGRHPDLYRRCEVVVVTNR